MVNVSANISGLNINPGIMNASGILSFPPKMLLKLSKINGIGAVVTKGIGKERREGWKDNPIIVRASEEIYLNALGYSDPGYKEIKKELRDILPFSKPLICSIYSDSIDGFVETTTGLEEYCDALEIVVSCPHCEENSCIGVPFEQDSKLLEKTVEIIREHIKKPLIIKISPLVYDIKKIARIIIDAGADGISVTNSIGPGMKIDVNAKKPILSAKRGGLSGPGIKPIGIWSVYQIFEELGSEVPIIGIGGISTVEDIVEYVLAGANAVQIGTSLFMHRNNFEEYLNSLHIELINWLKKEGYSSLTKLRGEAHD